MSSSVLTIGKFSIPTGGITNIINTVNAATDVDRDWQSYVQQQKQAELEQIIAEEKLKPAETQRFVAYAFRDGALKTTGTDIDQILPPVSRFGGGNRTEKKKTIIQRLAQFFENISEFSGFTPTCIPVHFGVYCK